MRCPVEEIFFAHGTIHTYTYDIGDEVVVIAGML